MTKVYNKLVRDKIPEIIKRQDMEVTWSKVGDDIRRRESKVEVKYRVLEGEELKKAAIAKLIEEAQELLGAKTDEEIIEEIADIYEVFNLILYDAFRIHSVGLYEYLVLLEKAIAKKKDTKGGFDRHYFLEEASIKLDFLEGTDDDNA